MSEGEVNLSELAKTRELIAKKCGQSVKERAKREEGEYEIFKTSLNHRDSEPYNDIVDKSCSIKIPSTTKNSDVDVSKEEENDGSNSFSTEVKTVCLPTNRKRYVIRSAKTKCIKVTPPWTPSSSSNKRGKTLKSFDANKLTKRLQMLLSVQDDGISPTQNFQHEIDSILYKLREMQVIL